MTKRFGFKSNCYSLPIPASVPKKYEVYIADVDNAGVEDGKKFYSCEGIAFRDASSDMAQHCFCGTVKEFIAALREAEKCACEVCKRNGY